MPITDQQQAAWRFENGANLGADSIGANNLTNNNAATQAAGKVGSALSLLAASLQSLSIASNAALQLGGSAWEITAWVYPASLTTGRAIVAKWDGTGTEYMLYWEPSNSQFTIAAKSSFDASLVFLGSGVTATALNQWYFLDAWEDPAANAGAGALSIAQDNGAPHTTAFLGPANSTRPFSIGAQSDGSSGPWNGRLDEIQIWKRLLTSGERTSLFNAGNLRRRAMATVY